ncbi:MAG: GGDEF domain-containing protein [Campylobacter sp.]|nr:GGDEF domain-containing protein [Campylobacter sp.]
MMKFFAFNKETNSEIIVLRIINILILIAHLAYLLIFSLMGIDELIALEFFSVSFYIYIFILALHDDGNLKICFTLLQLEITIHTVLCISRLGWGYGFEFTFFAFILSAFFIDIGNKIITYILLPLQFVLFFTLYELFFAYEVSYNHWNYVLFITNLFIICMFSVSITFLMKISNNLAAINADIHKAQINEILNYDPLTKLKNRNSLPQYYSQYLSTCETSYAVVMCDIDDFKNINDSFGHNAGDAVLVNIAKIFSSVFREYDMVCRWGGEEFLIIIYDVSRDATLRILERTRKMINESVVQYGKNDITVTMTYGVVYYEHGEVVQSINALIKIADDLLYEGKRSGKNKIIINKEESDEL